MKEQFTIDTELFDLTEINEHIVKYKVAIVSADTLANGFYFSKEVLNTLIPTIKGCPVSTYYDEQAKCFGGHEGDLYRSNTGLKRTPKPYAVGFCDYSDNGVFWQNLNLDGQNKDWLCGCVYLWKDRYPFIENLQDKTANQSMECELNYENKNGVKYVTECSFSGITLIGVQPAFDGSKFMQFSKVAFTDQVNELKNELTDFEKYNSLNFDIPEDVKSNLYKSSQVTSVCKEHINYLFSNNYVTPKELVSLHKYFSRCNEKSKEYLGGSKCENWVNTLIDNMSKIDRGDKMAEFAKEEDWGTGDYEIKIDKSKDSVSNDAWGDVDKTAQMNKIIKAKNGKSVVHDIYAEVDKDYVTKPSSDLKYPIMQVKSDTAVYNSNALSAALAYANHPDTGNAEVASKIKGIQKKLGLLKEDKTDTSKGGDKGKMSKKFNKQAKEEYAQKFSMTANQIIDAMNDACEAQTVGDNMCKFYVSDFDDTYMYCYNAETQGNCAIPYSVSADGIVPDFDNMKNAKMVNLWIIEDDDGYDDAEDDDTPSLFAKAKDEKMSKKLTDAQAETGKKFAEVTSLETALADEKKVNEERQKQIDDLSKQLKASKDNENMSKAKDLLNKKEFSVFSKDIKDKMLENDSVNSFDKFETFAYAELGKFTSTHLDYDENNAKFSFMYIPESTTTPETAVKEDDVYTEIKKKHNNKK